ncbi:MAG: DUF1524 domain-containing protein, partial [Promicromonosporaceae bacterium]|nr:DUF1524 domain-containing protein [Promicromonosporaceae bacterium]
EYDRVDATTDRYKLWPTNRDRSAFRMAMGLESTAVREDSALLTKARAFFDDEIARYLNANPGEVEADYLARAVRQGMELVSIQLDIDEDPQAIFETLNARGEPLSPADLIKNHIFQNLGGSEQEKEVKYEKYWQDLEDDWWSRQITSGRVTHPRFSWFLWHWLRVRELEDFPIGELFAHFTEFAKNYDGGVDEILPEIKRAAERYRNVIEGAETPDGALTREQWLQYRLAQLDIDVVRPLLVWLDEPEQDDIGESQRRRIIEILESWFVRRAIVKASSTGTNRLIVDLLIYLSKQPHTEIASALEGFLASQRSPVGYWPDDEQLLDALIGKRAFNNYRKSMTRMLLESLEDNRRGYPDGHRHALGPVKRGSATVEHLMPVRWREHWKDVLPADGDPIDDEYRDHVIHELGNLTLATGKFNASIGNQAWPKKVSRFEESNDLRITNDVLNHHRTAWEEAAITSRTNSLAHKIAEIWPVPKYHTGIADQVQVGLRRNTGTALRSRSSVRVKDLIEAGFLVPDSRLEPTWGGEKIRSAMVLADGDFEVDGGVYNSPSAAGKAALKPTGRRGENNGWTFWRVASTGRTLDDLRSEYLASLQADENEAN